MGVATEPSVYHSDSLQLILFLHRDTEDWKKTAVHIYDDEHPFAYQNSMTIPYDTYRGAFAKERRSAEEQQKDRSIYVGLYAG